MSILKISWKINTSAKFQKIANVYEIRILAAEALTDRMKRFWKIYRSAASVRKATANNSHFVRKIV